MLKQLSKMNRNLTGFKSNQTNILPFCYDLVISKNFGDSSQTSSTPKQSNTSSTSKNIEDNPYFAKYANKIKKAQVEKSKSFIDDLKNSSQNEETDKTTKKDKNSFSNLNKPNLQKENAKMNDLEEKFQQIASSPKSKRSLNDIVKLDILKEKDKTEIVNIWNEYHRNKDCIYAVIPSNIYESFYENSKQYPTFIVPLPRNSDQSSNGTYEFFLLQFQEHCCYFTPLAAYHLHKEIAPVCLTIYHYPELSKSKGIVLMMGEFDSNILDIMECQCLANQLQYYYTTNDAAPKLSLHLFNKEPKTFDHMRLVRHLEEGMMSSGTVNLNKQD